MSSSSLVEFEFAAAARLGGDSFAGLQGRQLSVSGERAHSKWLGIAAALVDLA